MKVITTLTFHLVMIFKISSRHFLMSQFVGDHTKIPEFLQVSSQHFLKIKLLSKVLVNFKNLFSDSAHLMYMYVGTNSMCITYCMFCKVIWYILYIL